jgi:hypothetical protein
MALNGPATPATSALPEVTQAAPAAANAPAKAESTATKKPGEAKHDSTHP